jgi:hypothetical protein
MSVTTRAGRREDRVFACKNAVDAKFFHEPAFFGSSMVVAARQRAGMPDSARQLRFPAADDAGDYRFGKFGVELVITAWLDTKHCRFAACVISKGESELGSGVLDVDVLAAGDQRRPAPAGQSQISRNRAGEVARVREDRNRAPLQRLPWGIPAKSATDPDLVPRVGDAEAVAAENVDTVVLADRADLPRVVHRHLLSDDEDLFEIRIDSDQLGDTVPRGRRREVDDTAIEAMAGIEALADIVVDGDVADRSLQHLPLTPGRSAEHDIAPRISVPHRRDLARLAAEDIENADAILARCNLSEGADADVIFEISDIIASHGRDPLIWNGREGVRPRVALR